MAWETRGNSRYYTRSVRENGKVRRRYYGKGPGAEWVAAVQQLRHAGRALPRLLEKIDQMEVAALDEPLEQLDTMADLLAVAALATAGYHQHKRGEWRKRHGTTGQGV